VAIPSYDQFISPLFLLLSAHPQGLSTKQAFELLAVQVGLTAEERETFLPSGRQRIFHNRIGWAHDRLKRDDLSLSLKRGFWCLTEKGKALRQQRPQGLTAADVERLLSLAKGEDGSADAVPTPTEHVGPEERIDIAVVELEEAVVGDLLSLIADASPGFFEVLVLDVLHAMGYGVSRAGLQNTGGSGDGGIDGIISLDKLGLDKVYVQAKRWQGTIARPAIQAFYGALAGQRASKGVFITTSDFSQGARDYAASVSGSLVLVNGRQLARLMVDHGVGVSVVRTVRLVRVDSDYFGE